MFAVIRTGGKQYQVEPGTVVEIEKLEAAEGETVTFSEVLLFNESGKVTVGAPVVEGASVVGRVLSQFKGEKLMSFKKWRRKGKQWRKGHRQQLTRVQITGINA